MTKTLQIIIILSACISCNSSNILKYKNQRFFEEKSVISLKEKNVLYQQVCYDKPKVIDEAYCHTLKITFIDLEEAKRKRFIDIKADSAIVKLDYSISSVWNWSDEKNEITGNIEILKWGNKEVKLKEHIHINDIRRKEKVHFKGRREFTIRKDLYF